MKTHTRIALASLLMCTAALPVMAKSPVVHHAIPETEVLATQQAWCKALVNISSAR